MAISFQKNANGTAQVLVAGRFDFRVHRDFGAAIKAIKGSALCEVDLRETTYLDSSALGMMLLLKDEVAAVKLCNCRPEVRKVLEIANFQRIFEIV
jgi:HptB-dependent secretion and biofilm anti anti-sigma factor